MPRASIVPALPSLLSLLSLSSLAVEALRQQQPITPALLHAAGDAFGLVAGAPEEVASHRPLDGAAGVLGHHQALDLAVGLAFAGRGRAADQPEGHAHRHVL